MKSKMEKKLEYPVKAVFGSKKNLEHYICGHNQQEDGTVLLFSSNTDGYEARYSSKKDKVILYLIGKTEEELVEANIRFFNYIDKFFKNRR